MLAVKHVVVVVINRYLGSSELYVCPNCGKVMDRDINAAINLRNYGLSLIA